MSRKNIFQLVEENYDIQIEIKKINRLFNESYYFENECDYFTLNQLIETYLFNSWKYRGTCVTIDEYFSRTDACISKVGRASEEEIINNIEVMENFTKLYFDNSTALYTEYKIQYYDEFKMVFYSLIKTLEKRMGLTAREYADRIIVYPHKAPLEKVIELCEEDDVQWELIRYVRENMSLAEKRKSLAYLATNLYIEEDADEKDMHIRSLVSYAGNVLNNLHIRHNNKTGKWENKVLEKIDEDDAIVLCDMVYNEMLLIVLLREHKNYEKIYNDFNQKQKETRVKKKAEENKR